MPPVTPPSQKPTATGRVTGVSLKRLIVPEGIDPEHAISGIRNEVGYDQIVIDKSLQTRIKTNRMRQRISQRLKDAQNTYAMLTTFNEIDMRFGF